jgi:predicted phosphodiesterase
VHKVLILGDSHARGCASKVRNQLNNEYEVCGYINPGSEMKNLKESAKTKMVQLTNDDNVVLWGGFK